MINLRPDLSSYARVSYARELYGDVEGAMQAMGQAAQAGGPAPENAGWAHVQLGTLYFNSGRLDQAEHEYDAALAVYPGYFHAQAGLAAVRAAQGRTAEAVTLYKAAVAVVPLPQYVQALGDLYAATGNAKDAQAQYDLVELHLPRLRSQWRGCEHGEGGFLADQDQDAAGAVNWRRAPPPGGTISTPRTPWPGRSTGRGAMPRRWRRNSRPCAWARRTRSSISIWA